MQPDQSIAGIFGGGAFSITVGLISITEQLFRTLHWGFSWYILSLLFFMGMFMSRKKAARLAIPACILGGIGLGMSFYSLTHHWKMMFYFWAPLIWFTGTGIYITGWKTGCLEQKVRGLRVMKAGFFLFIVFGTFFEMLFSRWTALAFPGLVITAGVCILLSRFRCFSLKRNLPSTLVSSANPQ